MTFCFDLDGTLCSNVEGDHYTEATPLFHHIERVNELYDEGHTIKIDTARGSTTGIDWTGATEKQLKEWGVKYHELRCGVKMFADIYIDDKGINLNFFEK
jgi:hypothetical protein